MNKELRDIAVSTLVISFAFGWIGIWPWITGSSSGVSATLAFAFALGAVGLGFILHELAHRFMAKKFGAHAEFKAWRFGLLMAIGTAIISGGSIVFAAPGAVQIRANPHSRWFRLNKRMEVEEIGITSLVGPLTNIGLSVVFMFLGLFVNGGILAQFFATGANINAWLALFNLLPIPPLDGAKVMTWDPKGWGIATTVAIIALILA